MPIQTILLYSVGGWPWQKLNPLHILRNRQSSPGTWELPARAPTDRNAVIFLSGGRPGAGTERDRGRRGWRNILWHYDVPVALPPFFLTTPFFILSSLPSVCDTPPQILLATNSLDCLTAVATTLTGVSPSPDSYCRARGAHGDDGRTDTDADGGVALQGGLVTPYTAPRFVRATLVRQSARRPVTV